MRENLPRLIMGFFREALPSWCRSRLTPLRELTRDDWLLAAVSSRCGLTTRVQHILNGPRPNPLLGRCWTCMTVLLAAAAAIGLAMAQSRPPATTPARDERSGLPPMTNTTSRPTDALRGTVNTLDGKPAANATVLWIGDRKPILNYATDPPIVPKGKELRTADREQVLGRTATDRSGRFQFSASLDPGRFYPDSRVVVLAEGWGLFTRHVKSGETEVALTVTPEVVIKGRLLSTSGTPAAGARVTLQSLSGETPRQVEFLGLTEHDAELPVYWPRSEITDQDGRFTLHGIPSSSYARLSIRHPDHAVDELTVDTRPPGPVPDHLKRLESGPVPPTFTHTLEPARPVQGRVTDKETGKPLPGVLVELNPFRQNTSQTFRTLTDADGRYRISGHQADQYWTTVYPAPDSGLISIQNRQGWPAGAKVLEVNFALGRGRLVRGKVVNAETRQPISGAVVLYEPGRGNPNDLPGYNLNNPTRPMIRASSQSRA